MSAAPTEHAHPGFERLVAKLRAEREAAAPRTLAERDVWWHRKLAATLRESARHERAIAARSDITAAARTHLLGTAARHDDDAERHDELARMAGA